MYLTVEKGSPHAVLKQKLVLAFWRLPHEFRRTLFRALRPNTFAFYQWLQNPENPDRHSLSHFEQHQCIFVHVPKTAGNSITQSLFHKSTGSHRTILFYQLIYPHSTYKRYFKFAFVRNPYDRLVSAFQFLKRGGLSASDRAWAESNLSQFEDFDSFVKGWVNAKNIFAWQHFHPQFYYICDTSEKIQVDFIGRYERLADDFDLVARKLNIQTELQHRNRSQNNQQHYQEYYTEESRRIVANVYARDFRILGYENNG